MRKKEFGKTRCFKSDRETDLRLEKFAKEKRKPISDILRVAVEEYLLKANSEEAGAKRENKKEL